MRAPTDSSAHTLPQPAADTPRSAPPRRWRGLRTLLVLATISIGWKVLLFGIGGTMARLLVDDGLGAVPAELQPYALQATAVARALWAGPVERHGVRGVRLVSIERRPEAEAEACGGLSARVRAYTFFAIPYSEVRTVCDHGTVEYRVLRRRTRAN